MKLTIVFEWLRTIWNNKSISSYRWNYGQFHNRNMPPLNNACLSVAEMVQVQSSGSKSSIRIKFDAYQFNSRYVQIRSQGGLERDSNACTLVLTVVCTGRSVYWSCVLAVVCIILICIHHFLAQCGKWC